MSYKLNSGLLLPFGREFCVFVSRVGFRDCSCVGSGFGLVLATRGAFPQPPNGAVLSTSVLESWSTSTQ